MSNLIDRQAAIKALNNWFFNSTDDRSPKQVIEALPSAEPEISRIEQELHGKTPEEQYEFLYWLLLKFGLAYTDSRLAVIEWLRGERNA